MLQVAIKGTEHIIATAKGIARIRYEKCNSARAEAAHYSKHFPYNSNPKPKSGRRERSRRRSWRRSE